MKNKGIWYAVGAAVVGLGAWFMFSKKAEAQSVVDPNGNVITDSWKTLVVDTQPTNASELQTLQTWAQDPVNAADLKKRNADLAAHCLPFGQIMSMDLVQVTSDTGLIRFTFRYLDDTNSVDTAAATACLRQGGL